MRCSWCEPLLDRYLEGTLSPAQLSEVTAHLRTCDRCTRLLEELKVVDALLLTTKVPELPANFTFAVLAQTNALPVPKAREHPLWSFIALYVTAAWVAALAGMALGGVSFAKLSATIVASLGRIAHVLGAGVTAMGHGVPALATFGLGVLLVDLAVAAAACLLYFFIRPRLAAQLAPISEAP